MLSGRSREILDGVLAAMQPAEELSGPEGADYEALMRAIAEEAATRAETMRASLDVAGMDAETGPA